MQNFRKYLAEFDQLNEDEISKKFIPTLWLKKMPAKVGQPEEVREGVKTMSVLKSTLRKYTNWFIKVDGKPFALAVGTDVVFVKGDLAVTADDKSDTVEWIWGKTSGYISHKQTENLSLRASVVLTSLQSLVDFDVNSMEKYRIDVYSIEALPVEE